MNHFFLLIAVFGVACAARLTGTITTTTSDIPSYTTIYAINTDTGSSYQTRTATNSYNMNLQEGHSYSVFAVATGNYNVSGWTVDGFMPVAVGRVTLHEGEVITANLAFQPSYTLILISYANGAMRRASDYSSYLWTTDLSGVTSRFYKSLASQNGFTTAALAIPLGTKVSVVSETQLASGRTLVPADNSGEGFGSSTQGGAVVQLNYEMARTATISVKRKSEIENQPSNIQAHAASIDALSGPFASEQLRAATADQILEQSVAAETALELSKAEALIAQYRTSNVSVRGHDELGRVVPGLSISIKQKSQNFRFGVYGGQKSANGLEAWKMLADSGVNAAVIDFWWSKTEPKQGTIEEDWIINQKIDYLTSLGFNLRATGLFQPDPDTLPDYVKGLSSAEFGQALYNHVHTLVSKYCTNFELIEVSTDLNNLASLMGFNTTEMLALQQISLEAIRAAAPGVRTSVTVSNLFDPSFPSSSLSVAEYYSKWTPQQVDLIGQALYNGDGDQPRYSIGALSDLLDSAAASGKPIRLSQVSAPFTTSDQAAEKQYIKQLYTIAFSKRLMKEVSWWDFMGQGALFSDDQTPTPSYWALNEFIQSTRSDIQLNVEDGNVAYIAPFAGTHQVTVYKDGAIVGQSDISVDEGRLNTLAVLYKSDGSGTVMLNQPNGPVLGVVPAPLASSWTPAGNSNSRLPQWSIFVIIFGSVGVVSTIALLAAFLVLRRNKAKDVDTGSEAPKVLPGKSFEIDLEAGPVSSVVALEDSVPDSPSPWSGQPLTNVVLDDLEDEVQQQSEESEESSELEDVELDEQEISTDTTDTEEEEHL